MKNIYDLYTDSDYDRTLTADEVAGGDLIGGIVDVDDAHDSADGTSKVMTHTEHSKAVRDVMVGLGNTWTAPQTFDDVEILGDVRTVNASVSDADTNTIVGVDAGGDPTAASVFDQVTAIGSGACSATTTGSVLENITAIGYQACRKLEEGKHQIAIGMRALGELISGDGIVSKDIVAIGHGAGGGILSGERNVNIGALSGYGTWWGSRNTCIGRDAGRIEGGVSVDKCVMLGASATLSYPDSDIENLILIGADVSTPSTSVTTDFLNIGDFLRGDMGTGELYQPCPTGEIAAADLNNNEAGLYADGSNHLWLKWKDGSGTVRTLDLGEAT